MERGGGQRERGMRRSYRNKGREEEDEERGEGMKDRQAKLIADREGRERGGRE